MEVLGCAPRVSTELGSQVLRPHYPRELQKQVRRPEISRFTRQSACRAVGQAGDWGSRSWGIDDSGASDYPDVSLLTQSERDMVLTLLPSSEQIQFTNSSTVVTWVAAALIFILAASKSTTLAVLGGTYPVYGSIVKAAYKNFSLRNNNKRFAGMWHAQVLELSIVDGYPGGQDISTSLHLKIGEPGTNGFSSELQVPWVSGCEQLQKADQVEALVMSESQYFEEFVVVRDLYVPALGLWLAEYPFLKRDIFERLSEDVYWSRQTETNQDDQKW